jgi:hypothetical protein
MFVYLPLGHVEQYDCLEYMPAAHAAQNVLPAMSLKWPAEQAPQMPTDDDLYRICYLVTNI